MPVDRNVVAKANFYFDAWNAQQRAAGRRADRLNGNFRQVLRSLIWLMGRRTSISYGEIAANAGVCKDTVGRAIHLLKRAGIILWQNRYAWNPRHRKVTRTTNSYTFNYDHLFKSLPKTDFQPVAQKGGLKDASQWPPRAPIVSRKRWQGDLHPDLYLPLEEALRRAKAIFSKGS